MKQVALLLVMVLMVSGCNNMRTLQSTTSGSWQAQMLGGVGQASGFSFITQFTVNSDSTLNISFFQFLTVNSASGITPCFPINGGIVTGSIAQYVVNTNDTVTGTLTYTVASNGNTLTLVGNLTGTASAGCTGAGGSFTMNQS
jgi:hypothetical protein